MSYDNVCKYLAENYPSEFVRWLLSINDVNIQVLKTELSLEPIRADSVSFLRIADKILHVESETDPYSNPPIPFRMLDYSVRLKRQYKCDVEQVVIFLKETTSELVSIEEYRDRTTRHCYRAIRLWEQDPMPFLANVALLPLATLTRTADPQALLEQVAERVSIIEDVSQRRNISGCTEILAGLRFEKNLIRYCFREEIMRESVIYQDILEKGLQEGRQRGRQEGKQEGREEGKQEGREEGKQEGREEGKQEGREEGKQEEALSLIVRLLRRRLGIIDPMLLPIQKLSVEQLEALGEALLDFSEVADLAAWLEQQEKQENDSNS